MPKKDEIGFWVGFICGIVVGFLVVCFISHVAYLWLTAKIAAGVI